MGNISDFSLEQQEMIIKLFSDIPIQREHINLLPDFKLINDNYLRIQDRDEYYIAVISNVDGNYLFTTDNFENFEQLYDECIIFKELILPKFL